MVNYYDDYDSHHDFTTDSDGDCAIDTSIILKFLWLFVALSAKLSLSSTMTVSI